MKKSLARFLVASGGNCPPLVRDIPKPAPTFQQSVLVFQGRAWRVLRWANTTADSARDIALACLLNGSPLPSTVRVVPE